MSPVEPVSPAAIERAAGFLKNGKLVAFATETVYGLGADATNADAVAAIFEAKGRPRFNPLIIHVHKISAARKIVRFDTRAEALAAKYWPGPLTFVLPRVPDCPVSQLAGAGLETLAVRIPAQPSARRLLSAANTPVAAPSANKSGMVSPTTATHVAEAFGEELALVLDDGPCRIGLESTVLDLSATRPVILRPGGITADEIEGVIGPLGVAAPDQPDQPASPGMLSRHYATRAPMRLNAESVEAGEVLLAFGANLPSHDGPVQNLSESGDLRQAAANLFGMMRRLDEGGPAAIAVMPVPDTGLGIAINDRLRRAAQR